MEDLEIEDINILKDKIFNLFIFLNDNNLNAYNIEKDIICLIKLNSLSLLINDKKDYLKISNNFFQIKDKYIKNNIYEKLVLKSQFKK